MTRLAEGLSSSATLRIRAVSMLAILMMTMFAPVEGRADEECGLGCPTVASQICMEFESCEGQGYGSCGPTTGNCAGCGYVWKCAFVASGDPEACEDEGGYARLCSYE